MSQLSMRTKKLNLFLERYAQKPPEMSVIAFRAKHRYRNDEYYNMRKMLLSLGRLDKNCEVVKKAKRISSQEILEAPSPYKKAAKPQRKENGKELLKEALEFQVKDHGEMLIPLSEYTRMIIKLTKDGIIK